MLNSVPNSVNKLLRSVVVNHPNSWGGYILEKQLAATAPQTLGGIGLISNEDEDDYTYQLKGECYALPVYDGVGQSYTMGENTNMTGFDAQEFRFIIEPEPDLNAVERFEIKKTDLLFLVIGTDIQNSPHVAYEIVEVESVNNIPPFTVRYVTNRRSDLDINTL